MIYVVGRNLYDTNMSTNIYETSSILETSKYPECKPYLISIIYITNFFCESVSIQTFIHRRMWVGKSKFWTKNWIDFESWHPKMISTKITDDTSLDFFCPRAWTTLMSGELENKSNSHIKKVTWTVFTL